MVKKVTRKKKLTPEQERNALIFRLRGYYSNAMTLPFTASEMQSILKCVDAALIRLGAQTQSEYMKANKKT